MTLMDTGRTSPVDMPEESRAAFHLDQLAAIFDIPQGAERAAAAAKYVAFLDECMENAGDIRDVEVRRLRKLGWGPTQLGKALGVHTSRGFQLLDRAEKNHQHASQSVGRLRRRVRSHRGDINLADEDT